ncbi:MAG: YaiI/YqxD family protein, partial [Gammaproteobacteria bacterium]|nr:YaiI/YqxD family protein [Gammaproteobacteria bacterium]
MKIYVDADACPNVIKEILFRSAQRTGVATIFVANQYVKVPRFSNISCKVVSQGFDEADNWIVEQCHAGDLVISQDIPLADQAISKGATVISPKGVLFTHENIKQRLTMRNFMEELRGAGENIG